MKRNHKQLSNGLIITLLLISLSGFAQPQATLVYPDENGKLVYEKHANIEEANADNIIIDYSNRCLKEGSI